MKDAIPKNSAQANATSGHGDRVRVWVRTRVSVRVSVFSIISIMPQFCIEQGTLLPPRGRILITRVCWFI